MTIYFIYAFMSQHDLVRVNRYGQYDIFKHSKELDGLNCVLWGFTDSKKIKNQFLEERPVTRRYIVEKKEMSESEYSNYMMDHFRFELLPAYLDKRINIGSKSGYQNTTVMKTRVSDAENDFYIKRIITKYEFDYIVNNMGEICTTMEEDVYAKITLPVDISVYVSPVAKLMELMNFEFEMTVYQLPFNTVHARDQIKRITNVRDTFSIANLFYYVFAEMIYREVIE